MDNPDGFLITALSHEILRRFIDSEEGKANKELDHGYSSHGNDEIPPAHVLRPVTHGVFLASEVP